MYSANSNLKHCHYTIVDSVYGQNLDDIRSTYGLLGLDSADHNITGFDLNTRRVMYMTMPAIKHIAEGMRGDKHVVVVVFADGSKIIKECLPEDNYDINVGVALCIADRLMGSVTQFHKLVKNKLAVKKVKKTTKGISEENNKDTK